MPIGVLSSYRSLNNKIKYQQDILQQYQKQKKYLLRQMFI